jgi:DNA polymerase III delta prime subunit
MNKIEQAINILRGVSGLDIDQSKLALYYVIATWKLPELDRCPILRFIGPPGTGKSSAIDLLRYWCFKPRSISGEEISVPAMRDELSKANNGTALIEEADLAADLMGCERLYGARYDRKTANVVVKESNDKNWSQVEKVIFGATILYYRRAFMDQAIHSRSVTIVTQFHQVNHIKPSLTEVQDLAPVLSQLGTCINLQEVADIGTGRIHDTWATLLAVAHLIHDHEWIKWAIQRMESETRDLQDGHAYELSGQILSQTVQSLTDKSSNTIICKQLTVQSDIIDPLRRQLIKLTPFQVSQQLREMGFTLVRTGGQNKFTPTFESLKRAASKIGYQDTLLQ